MLDLMPRAFEHVDRPDLAEGSPPSTENEFLVKDYEIAIQDLGDQTWKARALCAGRASGFATGDFFIDVTVYANNTNRYKRMRERAKALCAACPVSADCLDFALRNHIDHGIWGGTTSLERRMMREAGSAP